MKYSDMTLIFNHMFLVAFLIIGMVGAMLDLIVIPVVMAICYILLAVSCAKRLYYKKEEEE